MRKKKRRVKAMRPSDGGGERGGRRAAGIEIKEQSAVSGGAGALSKRCKRASQREERGGVEREGREPVANGGLGSPPR